MVQFIKILLLEDSIADQVYIRRCLLRAKIGALTTACDNKTSYLKYLQTLQPDIIILDYCVPGFFSNEAFTLAKSYFPNIPVIYITSSVSSKIAEETCLSESDAFLIKDNMSLLPGVIERLLLRN
tara:strand:- start:264 stop:638 length:375 start_codon:yes stop_codon:yes gene_type:complete